MHMVTKWHSLNSAWKESGVLRRSLLRLDRCTVKRWLSETPTNLILYAMVPNTLVVATYLAKPYFWCQNASSDTPVRSPAFTVAVSGSYASKACSIHTTHKLGAWAFQQLINLCKGVPAN